MSLPEPKLTDPSDHVILYVDDDADDRMLLTDAINITFPIYEAIGVSDGIEALQYLNKHRSSQLPCLVILDLNMPGMNGKEVLREMKKNEELLKIPVVIFTTSSNPSDKKEFADMGVDMITKPATFSELTAMIKKLLGYCNPELQAPD